MLSLRATSFRQSLAPLISRVALSPSTPSGLAGSFHLLPTTVAQLGRRSFNMSTITEASKPSSSFQQPEWVPPKADQESPVLKVYNSLTRSKDVFVCRKRRHVYWYNCGPTVYDAAHMGHARNYLTQDIIRRILRDYFNYNVTFVMNITDIDDKIILRARESHLLEEYISANASLSSSILDDISKAFSTYINAKLTKFNSSPPTSSSSDSASTLYKQILELDRNSEWAKAAREKDEKFDLYLASLDKAKRAIEKAEERLSSQDRGEAYVKELVEGTSDVLGPYLGETRGNAISNPIEVSRRLAAYWEGKFFEDMARLRILPPDIITRVSEYIPEIVSFVEGIIANGFAYVGGGSVWFNVTKFDGAEGNGFRHEYAKLQPGSKGNKKLLDEGEGALTGSSGKRQPADFALWKGAKPGEPAWESPWGPGRPGWHIECSVMASEVFGDGMDIHSGGVDLMFPHHDNELAQAEAYHGCRQWVNYFLHTGHLHIEGLKMSKSLKNFITIEDALQSYSARQLRLAFMLQTWNAKMDFKADLISDVKTKEETIDNFFANVKARIAQARVLAPEADGQHHYDGLEKTLESRLHAAEDEFHAALCDSFNTPTAINAILDLIRETNIYLSANKQPKLDLLKQIAEWVTRMLKMFGLGEGVPVEEIGWGKEGEGAAVSGDSETRLYSALHVMSDFRDKVRNLAKSGAQSNEYVTLCDQFQEAELGDIQGSEPRLTEIRRVTLKFRDDVRERATSASSANDFLRLCDTFRDEDLVNLGVQLEDGQGVNGGTLYKLVDSAILIRQRDQKAAEAAEKAAKKEANARAEEEKRRAKLEKGRVPPTEMFKPPNVPEASWSKWDDQGLPTHDGEGKEISKGASKKVAKDWKAQEKLHEEYLRSQ